MSMAMAIPEKPTNGQPLPEENHTTENEIAFLRELEARGKRTQLRLYRKSVPHREWEGPGLHVDRAAVERELDRILGKEPSEEKREDYPGLVARIAGEWLNGGRLRKIMQTRHWVGEDEEN